MKNYKNLDDLYSAMLADDPEAQNSHSNYSADLPMFGGGEPDTGTIEVWSWDTTRLIAGTCNDDLEIVSRKKWTGSRK